MFGTILLLLPDGFAAMPAASSSYGAGAESLVGTSSPRRGLDYIVHSTAVMSVKIRGEYGSTADDGQQIKTAWTVANGNKKMDYQDGTFAGRSDTAMSANHLEIENSEHIDFDLFDLTNVDIGHGAGLDQLGTPHQTSRIYAMSIRNVNYDEGSSGSLIIGGATTNPWTSALSSSGEITLPPDSIFLLFGDDVAGMSVSSSNCNLRLEASGGNVVVGINYAACSN